MKAKDGEAVVFSWVEWPDKPTPDAAWKRMPEEMPMSGSTISGASIVSRRTRLR